MFRGLLVLIVIALTAPSLAAAQTISFGGAAALLAKSCAAEIDANCRGVNLDSTRMKECLTRNQDVLSQQARALRAAGWREDRRTGRWSHPTKTNGELLMSEAEMVEATGSDWPEELRR